MITESRGSEIDCNMLRARIVELETTLSAAKQNVLMTPTSDANFDSTRTNSVIKLVEALNRAAHEVETPKPWPKVAPQTDNKEQPCQQMLGAIDQTIQRYNTKKVLTSAASTLQYQQRISDKRKLDSVDVHGGTPKPDRVLELLSKLDIKEKQVISLTTENLQLKAKVSKLKTQLKSIDTATEAFPVDKENKLNSSVPFSEYQTQSLADLNSKIAKDLNARIDELRSEAEEKLSAAALQVDALQKQLDTKIDEVSTLGKEIKRLESKLKEYESVNKSSTDSSISNNDESDNSNESTNMSEAQVEILKVHIDELSLKKKYVDLTKAYNDSCQAQSTMKATMGQAVEKLRQFITELEDKNKQLQTARKENDALKSRLVILERGTFLPLSSVLSAELTGNNLGENESSNLGIGVNSSCILGNSYEQTTLAALNAMSDEHFLLHGTQEEHHRIAYLRQAFLRLFQTKTQMNPNEMMSLGRVICSLLSVEPATQEEIVDAIGKMASAANVSTGILNVFNIFD